MERDLRRGIVARLRALGLEGTEPLLVALSGGMDSVVLLHLVRRATAHPVLAAHFDHAMRPESASDADQVAAMCADWKVPLERGRADPPPRGEAEARTARYAFLREALGRTGAAAILTAHHADDQAETVLFRAARGSGIRGLRGIRERRGVLLRPLLPWTRAELAAYAQGEGLSWREDPSNTLLDARRNVLRHRLLPVLEREVAPGAARNLARLARLAAQREEALRALAGPWLARAVAATEPELVLHREPFLELPPSAAAELLRLLLEGFGAGLDMAGTRSAVAFITHAPSGRTLRPGGGCELLTEFDRVRVRAGALPENAELVIEAADEGGGVLRLAGRERRVRWSPGGPGERVAVAEGRFPLRLRGWRAGDALIRDGRRRSVRASFQRGRVPRGERARTPVLEDAAGEVRWCAETGAADDPGSPHHVLYLELADD